MYELDQILSKQQTFELGHWPTPLQHLPRLSEELGGPRIWLKRDDCSGLATGGNKTRKLEYLVGDAKNKKADTLVTFGAIQSNHARQTAAAAAKAGLHCHLLLTRQVNNETSRYETGGNVLFDNLFGAQLHLFEAEDQAGMKARLQQIREETNAYVIPGGGSNAVGALGYAQAALELIRQCAIQEVQCEQIFHASSSAGTQAGLLAGFSTANHQARVTGINVYHRNPETLTRSIQGLCLALEEDFGLRSTGTEQIDVNHAYYGEGYGIPTQECVQAIRMLARSEGILFDPVYSGKAAAALIDQINLGNLNHLDDVIFIHTGGVQSLNVYEETFAE